MKGFEEQQHREDPAHTGEAQSVHRQKYDVDADPENPEVDDPELRVKDPVIEPVLAGIGAAKASRATPELHR